MKGSTGSRVFRPRRTGDTLRLNATIVEGNWMAEAHRIYRVRVLDTPRAAVRVITGP